jgi:hypothetical protein
MVKVAEPVEAIEPVETTEPLEVVIISGPRKGEIVRLSQESVPEVSDEEIGLLNQALDQVLSALDRLEASVETAIDTFSSPSKVA